MARRAALIVVMCLVIGPARAHAQQASSPRRGKWWQAEDVQRQLALTSSQVDAIEKVWQKDLAERIRLRRELDALEAAWDDTLERGDVDDAEAQRLIDQVEEARMRRNKARTLVLLQMYRVLTPEQRKKLRELQGLPGPR